MTDIYRFRSHLLRVIALVAIVLVTPSSTQGAQRGVWSPPEPLSTAGRIASFPRITSDLTGGIHVVWGERSSDEKDAVPDAILYTSKQGGTWTQPVDILSAGVGELTYADAITTDPYGQLALIWHSDKALFMSKADPTQAGSAHAWSTYQVEPANVSGAVLAVDGSERYHVVYIVDNRELRHRASDDMGQTWQADTAIGSSAPAEQAWQYPTLAVQRENLYAAWTANTAATNWGPAGVRFSRSMDGGTTWDAVTEPVSGEGYGWPYLFAEPSGRLHLLWIGNLKVGGRYHRWSDDGGITWSATEVIVPADRLKGYAGRQTLLIDGAGQYHLIIPGYSERGDAIWYTTGSAGNWLPLVQFSGDFISPQAPDATLAQGRFIHAVWLEYETYNIWYAALDTGAAASAVAAIPTPASTQPNATATAPMPLAATITPQVTATPSFVAPAGNPPNDKGLSAILIGTLPAVLLLVAVVGVTLNRRSRR